MGFNIVRFATAIMLLAALGHHPYAYYTLLRFVVCGTATYSLYCAVKQNASELAFVFGTVALLFNPFLPVGLSRSIWAFVDIGTAGLFLWSIVDLKGININIKKD